MGGLIGVAVGFAIKKTQTPYRYMQAVQVVSYMGPESVAVLQDAQAPYECGDFDVLVNVKAASVQVIDAQICCGYGRNFRKILRKLYNVLSKNNTFLLGINSNFFRNLTCQ